MTKFIKGLATAALTASMLLPVAVFAQQGTNGTAIKTMRVRSSMINGSVVSVSGNSFVVQNKKNVSQTVNTTASTVFKETGQTSVSLNNIAQGENVRATGVWDSAKTNFTASTVTIVVKTASVSGTLSSLSGTTFTLTNKNNIAYTVDASNAKLVRHFGAAMQLTDMQTGDTLTVTGTINGTAVSAKTVRDITLQSRSGTFVGTVSAISGTSFTLQSKNRGSQTINTTSTTVFKQSGKTVAFSNIVSGQTVTVSGVWDRTNSNVTASRVTIKAAKKAAAVSTTTNQ